MIKKIKITDKNIFAGLIARMPVQNVVSMEAETSAGSYLDGDSWEYLKYVYNKDKDTNENPEWADYTIVEKTIDSPDSLVSDFEDMLHKCCRIEPTVIITCEED